MEAKEYLLESALAEKEIEIGSRKYIVREMNGKTYGEYEDSCIKMVEGKPVYNTKMAKKKMVLLSLHDSKGEPVFEKNDIGFLDQLPSSMINRIFSVAAKLNKLEDEKIEKN